jgi:uncharacterized protein (TIGR02453 family)
MKTLSHTSIPATALDFLKLVKQNNNRDWFNAHKERYLTELAHLEAFAEAVLQELNKEDMIETPSGKKSLHRIYRDTRFSKEKTPYKTNWSGSYRRATKLRRGGYYFHIEPGNSFVAGGFWGPSADDLRRIRDEIAFDATPLRKILKAKNFVKSFGTLQGEQVKTTPKGYEADNEGIDLLRYKQYLLIKPFSDQEVLHPSFVKETVATFHHMRPFFDYMSEVLTTDINGISVI